MSKVELSTFKRLITEKLSEKLTKNRSFFLFGPRQTGKSTILESLFTTLPPEKQLRYYCQLPSTLESIEADPEIILREVKAKENYPIYLLIDEIQKVPKLMDVLQFLIDKKMVVVAASGSSARKMKTLGTNWLPGRVHLDYLYPLMWEESGILDHPTRLSEQLLFGALPGILATSDLRLRAQDLDAYTHLYLDEEIRKEAAVRNLPKFTKFLRLAALESGSAPNLTHIGREVGVSHTTIHEYFQILEDSLIIHRLDAFGSKRKDVLRSSKYYFFDIGVRNAAAHLGHDKGILPLQMGTLFEHLVILECVARFKPTAQLSYWRTKRKEEVDLVIDTAAHRVALEIKATAKPHYDDVKGLRAFMDYHKTDAGFLICQCPEAQQFGKIIALPWLQMERIHRHL